MNKTTKMALSNLMRFIICAVMLLFYLNAFAQVHITKDEWKRKLQERQGKRAEAMAKADLIDRTPEGFSQNTIEWDRSESNVTAIVFVGASDSLGVMIAGIKKGDRIEVSSASGIASFDDGSAFDFAVSLVSIGGQILAPEFKDQIKQAEEAVKQQFGKSNRHKERDPFGVDDDGDYQRCEGGVILCMPSAGGVYTSNKECIPRKLAPLRPGSFFSGFLPHGPRTFDRRPKHVKHGHFLVRPDEVDQPHPNRYFAQKDGEIYVVAWDRKFSDNQGFYRVVLQLTRADAVPVPIID